MSSSRLPVWATAPSPNRFIQLGALHALRNGQYLLDHPPELIRPIALAAGISLSDVADHNVVSVACERAGKLQELELLLVKGGYIPSLS